MFDDYLYWSLAHLLPLVLAEAGGGAYLLFAPRLRRPARAAGAVLVGLAVLRALLFVANYGLLQYAAAYGFPAWLQLYWRVTGVGTGVLQAGALAVVVWSVLAGYGRTGADDE